MKTFKKIFLLVAITAISGVFVSCEDVDETVNMSTSISYMLTISPDLLEFVTPEVTYVDSQGKIHTISGVKELDDLVNINYAYTPGIGVWTIQTIKGTNYKSWNLNMTFKDRPFHSYFGVKYKRNELAEIDPNKTYDFHHSIFSTTIYVNSKITQTVKYNFVTSPQTTISFGSGALVENHISFTKDCYYSGDDVEKYLNELVNTPDKMGFFIDEQGNFKERLDFPM